MGIHNNFPAPSWVKLDGISVVKGEEVYIVSDFKTNLKYIYWSSDTPNQLTASNVMLNRTATRFLIVVNNKGECVLVPNEEITVSFDGNSVGAINEHIWGLYEKDEEYGDRFVSVEQNIEGITQTVGETKEELGKVTEQVAKVEQKADSIDMSVKSLDREYNNNKEMQELRENVNKSIIKVNSAVGLFKAKVTEVFKDNEVSEDESVEIQAQIGILEDNKLKVLDQVDRVISLMEAEGNQPEVTKLSSQKQAFINAIDNVITLVNTSISDKVIVPSEITAVTDAFGKASLAVNTLKNTLDEIIFLGTGGTISEELARIGMKSDEIVLSVNKVEQKVDNDTAFIKNELVGQIKDVSDALNGLEDTMNGSFLDGVLSESEKIALKKNLDILATEKLDIDKQFESIYNNVDLTGEPKTALKTSYDTYTQRYTGLVEVINTVINKEGNIDIVDQSNVNRCIIAHREALGEFSTKANSAIDAIAGNKANTVDKKYSEILLTPDGIVNRVGRVESKANSNGNRIDSAESRIEQLADRVTSTVTVNDVKSIIEQSPTEIRYGFNDISDYVTIGTYGLTVNRGAIACHTLTTPPGEDPIIKLFPNGGESCSIDATRQYETGGKGSSVRLKWDAGNYLRVSDGNCAFHMDGTQKFSFYSSPNADYIRTTKGEIGCSSSGLLYQNKHLAFSDHTHADYAPSSHSHGWSDISGKPSSFTPSGHQHNGLSGGSYGTYIDSGGYMYPSGNIWFGNSSGSRWSRIACNDLYYYNYSTSSTKQIKSDIEYLKRKELRTSYSTATVNDFKIEKNLEREDFYNLFKDINFTTFIYDVKKGETGEQTLDRVHDGENLTCGFIMEDLEEIENPVVPLIVKQEYDMEGNPITEGVNQKRIDMNSYNNSLAIALQVAIEKIETLEQRVKELEEKQ